MNSPRSERQQTLRPRLIWSTMIVPPTVLLALLLWPNASPLRLEFAYADDLYHLAGFAMLAMPHAIFRRFSLLRTSVLLILFGAAVEAFQPLVGRDAELTDLLANTAGIGLGVLLGLSIRYVTEIRRRTRAG